jgi:hypothetical protein
LELGVSPVAIAALLVGHAGAAVLLLVSAVPWAGRVLLWTLLAASLAWHLPRHGTRRSAHAVTALLLEADGELSVRMGTDGPWQACAIARCALHPWIVLLRLRCPARRLPLDVLILPDATRRESLRRLRARLKVRSAVA